MSKKSKEFLEGSGGSSQGKKRGEKSFAHGKWHLEGDVTEGLLDKTTSGRDLEEVRESGIPWIPGESPEDGLTCAPGTMRKAVGSQPISPPPTVSSDFRSLLGQTFLRQFFEALLSGSSHLLAPSCLSRTDLIGVGSLFNSRSEF